MNWEESCRVNKQQIELWTLLCHEYKESIRSRTIKISKTNVMFDNCSDYNTKHHMEYQPC